MTDPQGNGSDLIYDWNVHETEPVRGRPPAQVDDETMRDGLQSASVRHPNIDEMVELLHCMNDLGMESVNIGLPGAGPHVVATAKRLAQEIRDQGMNILPNCAARTLKQDIEPVVRISQEIGIKIEVAMFIGSSPIRQYAEEWDLDHILRFTRDAVEFAVREGLPVMYVTEDTVRSSPEDLRVLMTAAVDAGAQRLCLCDTVGAAVPEGRCLGLRSWRNW